MYKIKNINALNQNESFLRFLRMYSIFTGWFILFYGAVFISVRLFNIPILPVLIPSMVTMKVNTVILFCSGSIALLFMMYKQESLFYTKVIRRIGVFISFVAVLTILQYLLKIDFRIDLLFFPDLSKEGPGEFAGRMSFNSAFCFLMLGLSLVFQDVKMTSRYTLSQGFILISFSLALVGIVGYVYAKPALLQLIDSSAMAFDTALFLFIISLGILNARPQAGIMGRIINESIGGRMIRYLIPAVVAFPIIIDLAVRWGIEMKLFDMDYQSIVHALGMIFLFGGFVWYILNKLDHVEEKSFYSSQLLQKVLDSIPQRIYWKDAEFRYLGCNEPFGSDAGVNSLDQIIGKTDRELVWNQNSEEYHQEDRLVLETEKSIYHHEKREDYGNERVVWKKTSKSPLHDSKGNVIGVLGTYEDVTEAKRAQQKYEAIINTSLDGFWVNDLQGTIHEVNDAYCRISGYSREELIGKNISEIESTETEEETKRRIQNIIKTGSDQFESSHKRADGEIIYVSLTVNYQPHIDTDRFFVFIRDITAAKAEREQIRLSEERYRLLTETSSDLIYLVDKEGKLIFVNDAAAQLLAITKEQTQGKIIEDVFPLTFAQQFKPLLNHVFTDGKEFSNEEKYILAGKSLWLSTILLPVKNEKGEIVQVLGNSRDISKKKEVEENLRGTTNFLENLITYANAPIMVWDAEFNITRANKACESLTGFSEEELLGKNATKIFSVNKTGNTDVLLKKLQSGQKWEAEEIEIKTKTGLTRTVLWNSAPIYDENGKTIIATITQGTDISDRILAEQERNRFFDLTLDYMCVAGLDGYFKKVNPAFMKTFGYSEQEFLSKPFFDFIHPEDIEPTMKALEKLSNMENITNFINRYKCKDGSYRWLHWASTPYHDQIYAAAHDITEIKRNEMALKESKDKLELANSAAEAGIWEWLFEDDKLVWDERMFNMFDIQQSEFAGTFKDFINCLHPDDIIMTQEAIQETLETGVPLDLTFRTITKENQKHFINAKAKIFKDEFDKDSKMIGVCLDVTNAKLSEERVVKAMYNLEQSNKELEQFAYVASHDLQEPLRMVSSFTQLLERRYKDKLDKDALEFIGYAVDGANRMHRLIADLLDYSRVTTRGKEPVQVKISSVIDIALANLQNKIKKTSAVITYDKLPVCPGDEIQLSRVFQNLIDNGIKFCKSTNPKIHISAEEKADHVVIGVSDNGIGISREYQEKVFIIFQRLHTKAEYTGTGIGLAICKRIVERHGGKIWFESKPGEGTTFYFTLSK